MAAGMTLVYRYSPWSQIVKRIYAPFFAIIFFSALISGSNPAPASAQQSIVDLILSVLAPPAIPTYYQPQAPQANEIWQPGYWANSNGNYFWVPGTWVMAPDPGLLWTPGFWAYNGSQYAWTPGYWAPQVGYYGGVNYGYGYYGNGYVGGNWVGNQFRYNTAVTNVNRTVIHNVFIDRTVVVNRWSHVSYNGGRGGINTRPTPRQVEMEHSHHVMPTNVQVQHERFAMQNRASFSTANHGRPVTTAVARPYTASNRPAAARVVQPQAAAHMAAQHAAVQHAAVEHRSAPVAHAAAVQHVTPEHVAPQHAMAPQSAAAPERAMAAQRAAAQQQRAAAPQRVMASQRTAAQQQRAAAPQRAPRAAAQPRAAQPKKPAAPPAGAPPDKRPGGGGERPH
jgi:WXXGXW repeat (2 copies)